MTGASGVCRRRVRLVIAASAAIQAILCTTLAVLTSQACPGFHR
jgi:hypothetical protein